MIRRRPSPSPEALSALPDTLHPLVRRLYAARGVASDAESALSLSTLAPPTLRGLDRAVDLLRDALRQGHRVVVAGDYDCDGATGVAVALRGLRLLGGTALDFVVPDRFRMGYGLSPALVDAAAAWLNSWIVMPTSNARRRKGSWSNDPRSMVKIIYSDAVLLRSIYAV